MKFTLKGFFSILLLIAAAGSVATSYASHDSSNGSCGTDGCVKDSDCGCTAVCIDCCPMLQNKDNVYGKTYFAGRGQHWNEARKMMGVEDKIHLFGKEGFYGVASIAVEYQQIFNNRTDNNAPKDIGRWFSMNGGAEMTYGNDFVALNQEGNGNFDINALNFGVTSSGSIFFCPKKSDIIVDLDLFLGLDECFCGFWTRFYLPIVNTRWDLNIQDNKTGDGSQTYPLDYVGREDAGEATSLCDVVFDNMKTAFKGEKGFCDAPKLKKGKICGRRTDTAVAALRVDLGYDFFRRERWHFAASFDFTAPLGTRPCAEFLFDAVVGESRRWEVGGSLNAAYRLWDNCDATQNLTLYFDSTINTLLARRQERLVGLFIDGEASPWSQYLLLKKFNGSGTAVGLERAANILAGDLQISAPVVGDLALMLQWTCNCFFAGLGYEFWGRSEERIKGRCFGIADKTYGIKGSTEWTGNDGESNFTASKTTISTDAAVDLDATDNPTTVFLSNDDLDLCVALHPGTYSNKVFGYLGYNWTDCDWQPYVLLGAEVEFGRQNRAFSQWGVIGKGGIAF